MAKQRGTKPHPSRQKPEKPAARGSVDRSTAQPAPPQPAPAKRTSFLEAVALYEKGVQALQRRDYREAADLLRSVLSQYPEEKELHERVRLYLNICERQVVPA